jgi:outer membrane protein insertion porin family
MMFRVNLLFLIFISLCGLTESKVLSKLEIQGLSINSAEMVRNALDIHEGGEFSSTAIQESIRRLYQMGLFRTVDFLVTSENDSAVSLALKLDEFPICENIEYSGNKKIKVKDFEEKMTLKRGQIISDAMLYDASKKIRDMYSEKGYLNAEVKTQNIPTKIPGNEIVKFDINEGPKVKITSIVFKGNKEIKTSTLEHKFKTKKSKWWRSGEFKEDLYRSHLDTLVMFYNDQGYLDASIVKDTFWNSGAKKDINIEVTVNEGKKYFAGEFYFTGNRVIDTDSLTSKIYLKKGRPFQKDRFDMTKYLIENAYREEGYLWVQVDDQKNYRGDTIDVTFNINEGRPAIVRKIDIRGNTKTMEKVIRREIDLLPGQKYKQSLMARSRQKIFALNFFSDVKPDLVPNEDGTIDLVFDIVEKDNIGQLQVGAAYSGTDGFVGTFSTSIPNFRGTGEELGINLQYGGYGGNTRDIRLRFKEPWAFDTPTSLSADVFYSRGLYTYGDTMTSVGFVLGAGRSKLSWPDDHFTVNGSYQFSYEKQTGSTLAKSTKVNVIEEGLLSRLTFEIMRYDFDMPLFPTTGSKLTITPQIAGLGGDFNYFKGTAEYEYHFPLPYKFVMGFNSKFGLITGLGKGVPKISQYDLFKIGGVYGDGNLRGYEDYQFGGWNTSHPENGLSMFTTSLELRYPIMEQQLYVAAFTDVGNTWSGLSEVNLTDLYKDAGVGVRINIPMLGLMGFDFGYGFDDPQKRLVNSKPHGWKFNFLMNRGF